MPLLSTSTLAILNAARSLLHELDANAMRETYDYPAKHVNQSPDATDFARVAAMAGVASDAIFEVLNTVNAYNVQELTYAELHGRPESRPEPEESVEELPRHELGDKVFVVRNMEEDGHPLLGEYLRTEEDTVAYIDAAGGIRHAPQDCVRIEPFTVSKVPDDEEAI